MSKTKKFWLSGVVFIAFVIIVTIIYINMGNYQQDLLTRH